MPAPQNSLAFAYPLLSDPYGFHLGSTLFRWIQEQAERQSEENRDGDLGSSSSADGFSEKNQKQLRKEANGLLKEMASHMSPDFLESSREMLSKMKGKDLNGYIEQLKQQLAEYKEAALAEKEAQAAARKEKTPLAMLSIFNKETLPVDVEMMTFHPVAPAHSPTRTSK